MFCLRAINPFESSITLHCVFGLNLSCSHIFEMLVKACTGNNILLKGDGVLLKQAVISKTAVCLFSTLVYLEWILTVTSFQLSLCLFVLSDFF